MKIIPLTLKQANKFIADNHRHHKKVISHRFSIGLKFDEELIGICVVGRPVSRGFDPYNIAEVTRLCVLENYPNACSKLYSCAARICKEMGFLKIITYILNTEPGTSLLASGWNKTGETQGGSWSSTKRPRIDKHPIIPKYRYEKILNK